MKKIFNISLILLVLIEFQFTVYSKPNVCPTGGPELYTNITDYQNASYKILAFKGDNTPIYDEYYVKTNEFDFAEVKKIYFCRIKSHLIKCSISYRTSKIQVSKSEIQTCNCQIYNCINKIKPFKC